MPANPYESLGPDSYWRSGVVEAGLEISKGFYKPKFNLNFDQEIATAGSCFAQHVARRLRKFGAKVIDEEPAPGGLPPHLTQTYGYGLYSARYGNIYTTRQLRQLLEEAFCARAPLSVVWEKAGRYYDGLRPSLEPLGFDSHEAVLFHRSEHLGAVRRVFERCSTLIFTMGLTETWEDRRDGTVYPTAPGVLALPGGDSEIRFKNLSYGDCLDDMSRVIEILSAISNGIRIILTVSPVPLTATASEQHVLVSTSFSKSVLRAVAGDARASFESVDYFPSYEVITNPAVRGLYYEANLRTVTNSGVEAVMKTFLGAHASVGRALDPVDLSPTRPVVSASGPADEIFCDEALLERFLNAP